MKIRHLWKVIGCLLILSFLLNNVSYAISSPTVNPELEVKSAQASPGKSATVDIVIHRSKGLKTFEFQLNYDHTALELSGGVVKKGKDVADWLYEYHVDSARGTVKVAAVNSDGFKTNDTVVVMSLTFKAIGEAGVSEFAVIDLKAYKDLNTSAVMTSKTGGFEIVSPLQPTPKPESSPSASPSPTPTQESNGHVSVRVEDEFVRGNIRDGQSKNVTFTIAAPKTAKSVEAIISGESAKLIAQSGKKLVIQTSIGDLEINGETIAELGGENITIRIEHEAPVDGKPARTVVIIVDGKKVTNFSSNIKVSVPYEVKMNESNERIIVYRMNEGQKVIVAQAMANDGKVVFLTRQASTFVIAYNSKVFADMRKHWATYSVDFVAARELFQGVSSSVFAPNGTMTRGMLATVLGRLSGVAMAASKTTFDDVDADKYYAPFIAFASDNRIVNGIGNGKFAPDKDVTREEMAQMIANFMNYAAISVTEADAVLPFADEQFISGWALPAIQQLQRYGIISGRPGNQFDAKGKLTRAEIAKVISVLIERIVQ